MLFLCYDPGSTGAHGVAAARVAEDGTLPGDPDRDVFEDAEAAW